MDFRDSDEWVNTRTGERFKVTATPGARYMADGEHYMLEPESSPLNLTTKATPPRMTFPWLAE